MKDETLSLEDSVNVFSKTGSHAITVQLGNSFITMPTFKACDLRWELGEVLSDSPIRTIQEGRE